MIAANHQALYNRLPSVETANDELRQGFDFDTVLTVLGTLILDHGLEGNVGVRLLHRHNDLAPNCFMLENLERLADGRLALATVMTTMPGADGGFLPSVWSCNRDGSIQPIEFGNTDLYDVGSEFFDQNGPFFTAFYAASSRLQVDHLLSCCLLSKKLAYDKSVETLSEMSEPSRYANIVVVKKRSEINPATHVETTWEFNRTAELNCARNCCNNCVWRSPGHDVSHKHSFHATDD